MDYKKSDYALNKYADGITYRSVTGEMIIITYEDIKEDYPELTPDDFQSFKEHSDSDYLDMCNADNNYNRKKDYFCEIKESALSPEEELALKELNANIQQALKSLTPTQLRRVRLLYFDGLTYRQIAEQEGHNTRAIFESVRQALNKIRKILF